MSIPAKLLPAALIALSFLGAAPATANDRPLIWEVSKNSEISYSARLGSRLPTARDSRLGAEFRMRGPDPRRYGNPLAIWASYHLAERYDPTHIRATRIDAWVDGNNGQRRLTLDNSFRFTSPKFDTELRQELIASQNPGETRKGNLRQFQSVRVVSAKTRSEIVLTASRRNSQRWATSVKLTQPVLDTWNFSAEMRRQSDAKTTGRFHAAYNYSW